MIYENFLDVPLPESYWEIASTVPKFVLIYPYGHPHSRAISIDMLIRLVCMEDSDYDDILQDRSELEDIEFTKGKFMDIKYIRECSITNITKTEWENNLGPGNAAEYLKIFNPDLGLQDYVKVVALTQPGYSLNSLKQSLRKGTKFE